MFKGRKNKLEGRSLAMPGIDLGVMCVFWTLSFFFISSDKEKKGVLNRRGCGDIPRVTITFVTCTMEQSLSLCPRDQVHQPTGAPRLAQKDTTLFRQQNCNQL